MTFRREVAPGIQIRQVQPHDAETIFRSVEENRAYLREWLPWVDPTQSAADVLQFIARVERQFADNLGPNAGIWVESRFCGAVGCHPIDWANHHCSIGYWLDAVSQGNGLVTRCCSVLLDYLFGELSLHRVTIRCATGNTRSCAIAARLGFAREGVLREVEWVNDRWLDMVVWGMLADDWRSGAASRGRPAPGS